MIKNDWEVRRDIITCAKKAFDRGLVAATDGNISMRMDVDRVMITPGGSSFATLNAGNLAYVDINGNLLDYACKPSSELPMHLEIYHRRSDIHAIIHAHPPYSTAFTIAGMSMSTPVIPEVVVMLGAVPTAKYATPSTTESADVIRDLILEHDVILLDHHGAVTCGATLDEAYYKMDKLEHAARTMLAANSLGAVNPLSDENLQKLQRFNKKSNSSEHY
jgi:L-fuculose-phosphate aldolase